MSEEQAVSKNEKPLLEVANLKQYFPVRGGVFGKKVGDVKAVDDVSLKIGKGKPWAWWARVDAGSRRWGNRSCGC